MNDPSSSRKPEHRSADGQIAALSPAEQRRLQQRFDQARRLMDQPGHDVRQVHELLAECVARQPGNTTFVEAFLRNLQHLPVPAPDAPQDDARAMLQQAIDRQDWNQVVVTGPHALLDTPKDVVVLMALALASQARDCVEAAVLYVKQSLQIEPEETETLRQAARVFSRVADIDQAITLWQQVEGADPYDSEAPQMIAQLTLEKMRRPPVKKSVDGGPDTQANEVAPNGQAVEHGELSDKQATLVQPLEKPKTLVLTERQRLERAIIDHPEDENHYLKLADFYLDEGRLYEAQRTLSRALSITSEVYVREKLEDVNLMRAQQQAQTARQHADQQRTVEALEIAEKLEKELQELEFDTARVRSDRYPDDKSLRFQLGLAWKGRGEFRQALEPLQAGLEVPEHRAVASMEIGEILQRYQQFPKALQCYRQAAQLAIKKPQNELVRKEALYRAGWLASQMKLHDSAIDYWEALAAVDSTYKDVRSRLDKLKEIDETDTFFPPTEAGRDGP
jgi:tetratricopeptide (TPR) repeat protein